MEKSGKNTEKKEKNRAVSHGLTPDNISRRHFLTRLGVAGVGIAGTSTIGILAADGGREQPIPLRHTSQVRDFSTHLETRPQGIVVAQGTAENATRAAIEALGGMDKFVLPKETVVIKPNVGWDRTPVQAANTNPHVVATLVRLCFEAGVSRVVVTDNTCNEARRCFTRSGIWKEVETAGGEIILPSDHRFLPYDLGGEILGRMPVLVPAVQAHRFINVAVAKHHSLSGFTGAMKNLYGVLGGRRNRLHQRIDASIADLASFLRPTLTVMDATRVLMRNGPQGGDVADTREIGEVIASIDPVAVDAYACTLIGLEAENLNYIAMAQHRGLGSADLTDLKRIGA